MWCLSCLLVFVVRTVGGAEGTGNTTLPTVETGTSNRSSSYMKPPQLHFWSNFEMMQRAFYVLIGISLLAVLYFVVRACSLRKKPQKKKYGLLSDYDETLELGSMESDEEKIFESRSLRR